MSDYLKVLTPDYIDDKTKHIVNGFIKTIQNSYKISTIPSEIIIITLLYVDDHFMMDRGSFQWKINDSLLIQNILSADTQQEFTSNTFEVGKLGWMLQLIPNDNNGDFGVYLGSLSIPKTWNVCVCYIMKCKQLNMKFIFTETYKVGDNWGAPTFSFNDVININPKQLTFDVSMKIIRIMSNNNIKYQSKINNYRKNYQLKWTINNNQKYKQQDIYSDIVGGMFCGNYSLVQQKAVVRLCGLPNKKQTNGYIIDSIQIQWTFHIIEANIMRSKVTKLGISKTASLTSTISIPSVSLDNFTQFDEIHFVIDIKILNEYDLEGNIIGANIENEWDKFLQKEQNINVLPKTNASVILDPIESDEIKTDSKIELNVMELQLKEQMSEIINIKQILMNKSMKQQNCYHCANEQFKVW
eukprot:525506_1